MLRMAYLYPDLMNLYADRGNVACLQQRCSWRGIDLRVTAVAWGVEISEPQDLYVIGGGQDRQQRAASEGLTGRHSDRIRQDVADGAALLAVCGGYQLMGRSYCDADGTIMPGLGVFGVETIHPGACVARCIGNIACRWEDTYLVGFENHGGRTFLGDGVQPLARVVHGFGNNGDDGTEGAMAGTAIGTYLHGSVLPKNPRLADRLLGMALKRVAPEYQLQGLDDYEEWQAHRAMLRIVGLSDSP
jgi:CobQ-like glutamine amidotransferase family enzyme